MKLKHSLTPYIKINSKWFKDLNTRHDTIKLVEENIGKTFSNINHGSVFLGQSPEAKEIKAKIHNWDLIKLKSFCTGNYQQNKRTIYEWGKISANNATDKGLISKIYKQFIQLSIKKNKQPNQKMGRRPK